MPLIAQLQQFSTESAATPQGAVQFRRARSPGCSGAVTHVLLHGIGSASASWLAQLQCVDRGFGSGLHIVAWDAPGYGGSEALAEQAPVAADYAARFWEWITALGADARAPFTLVGHSLGALMAASAAARRPERVARLVLLAPALGYANANVEVRERKLSERLASLAQWGPAGLAKKRAAAMLSTNASAEQVAFVEYVMAGIQPHGYTQAAHMLASGDVLADLRQLGCPMTIASGSADTITPPDACRTLAQKIGTPYVSLGAVGHTCALEAAVEVNKVIGIDSADNLQREAA